MPERRALGPGATTPVRPTRHFLLLAVVAALGCAVTAIVALDDSDEEAPAPVAVRSQAPWPDMPAFPILPEETISLRPPPSRTTVTSPAVAPVATRSSASKRPPSPSKAAAPSPSRTTTPPIALTVGATVGLEPSFRTGYRVRHRNYVARIDVISSSSSEGDRADSRFVVRTGRSASDCFSLESVNFPGYYLRHRDYGIRLDQAGSSKLFDADSTFCTASISSGTALTLRSYNYPSRYVALDGDRLILSESAATAFRPVPPA
ncbi:AbfB domain-containing protein [Actinoplanes sp. CA-015351]|uniref:AbfB domain-containing protein n=1 Tax=Actinoplanes sp. CA-015351 TaxID=3239897 RepID=UPI003D974F14